MIKRKILLAFIRVHILHHATYDTQGIYGAAMIKELNSHGYTISPGTLYPILHNMTKNGLLFYQKTLINGKQRKVYQTTAAGKKTLIELNGFIQELSKEVIFHQDSRN